MMVNVGLFFYVICCVCKYATIEVLTCVLSKVEGSDKDEVRYSRTEEHRIV